MPYSYRNAIAVILWLLYKLKVEGSYKTEQCILIKRVKNLREENELFHLDIKEENLGS